MAKDTFSTANLSDLMSNAGTNWSGIFGTDSFKPAAMQTAEQRATKNAPLNDTQNTQNLFGKQQLNTDPFNTSQQTNFKFDAPAMPNLDREQQFQQNEREATLAGQRAIQQQLTGAQRLASLGGDEYARKLALDNEQKNKEYYRQLNLLDLAKKGDTPRYIDLNLAPRLSMEGENQIMQLLQQGQNAENLYRLQAQDAALQRISNEKIAGIQQTGNLYSSLFNSLSASPSSNYRYWS